MVTDYILTKETDSW